MIQQKESWKYLASNYHQLSNNHPMILEVFSNYHPNYHPNDHSINSNNINPTLISNISNINIQRISMSLGFFNSPPSAKMEVVWSLRAAPAWMGTDASPLVRNYFSKASASGCCGKPSAIIITTMIYVYICYICYMYIYIYVICIYIYVICYMYIYIYT